MKVWGNMKEIRDKIRGVNKTSLIESKSASSTAIATVLLLGIVFSVFSVVHLGYVPEWKTDVEQSQMADVWEDMTELKSNIDRITILLISDHNSSAPKITRNIPLHTGSRKLPVIGSTEPTGTVSINGEKCKMTITPKNGNETVINCGTIAYSSNNNYYVDQTFKYENGALILAQKEQSVMKLYPSIRISEASPGNYSFLINAVEIKGSANTLSSNSDNFIHLKNYAFATVYDSDKDRNVGSFKLTIDTEHPDAWETYFYETMTGAGLEKNKDYTLNITENNSLYFAFPEDDSANLKRLYVGKTAVNAELVNGLS